MKTLNIIPGYVTLLLISIITPGCWGDTGSVRFKPGHMDIIQEREVTSFNKVELNGNFTVYLQNSSACSVSVQGDEEMLNVVLTEVVNGTLKIGYMNERYAGMDQSVVVNIKVADLLELSGRKSIKVITTEIFQFNELNLNFAGAVNLDLEVSGKTLKGQFAGASKVVLNGKVDTFKIEMPGAGKLQAFGLDAKYVDLNLAGAGNAEVNVSEQLKVDMAGACFVTYKGTPASVFSNISGIGRLKKVD